MPMILFLFHILILFKLIIIVFFILYKVIIGKQANNLTIPKEKPKSPSLDSCKNESSILNIIQSLLGENHLTRI